MKDITKNVHNLVKAAQYDYIVIISIRVKHQLDLDPYSDLYFAKVKKLYASEFPISEKMLIDIRLKLGSFNFILIKVSFN